ncbi:MAG: TonB family protein [Bacteroidota bacterium]
MKTSVYLLLFLFPIALAAQTGNLLIRSDVDCQLWIDTNAEGIALQSMVPVIKSLSVGDHLVAATTGGMRKDYVVTVEADRQSVCLIQLNEPSSSPTGKNTPQKEVTPQNALMTRIPGLIDFVELDGRQPLRLAPPFIDAGQKTKISFRFWIEKDGKVLEAQSLDADVNPDFKQAGIEAIKKWRFLPKADTERQQVETVITFKLRA